MCVSLALAGCASYSGLVTQGTSLHAKDLKAAQALKAARPWLRIAVHRDIGAKAVLVAPDTVWISSSDFGKTGKLESAVGFHSPSLYSQTRSQLFDKAWREAQELMDHPEITKG